MKKIFLILCGLAMIAGCTKTETDFQTETELSTRATQSSYTVSLLFSGGGGQSLQFWAKSDNYPYNGGVLSFVLRDVQDPSFSYQLFDLYVTMELVGGYGMYSEIYYPVLITGNSYIDINTIQISNSGATYGATLNTCLPVRAPGSGGPGGSGDPGCIDTQLCWRAPLLPNQKLEMNFKA